MNLLKNAEQSIPEGREGHVLVRLKTVLGKIILLVKDNGCGIPESIRDRISEPNFTTKSGGTGLGLAMSYKIIEAREARLLLKVWRMKVRRFMWY